LSTLYIRLPSKTAAESVPHWPALSCPFALVSPGNAIEREGEAPLADLSEVAARAQRVVLLLAASDVTLLRVQVPPLSGARLKAALPHLVEDQLMTDPAECALAVGDMRDGLRSVAVVQRGWLEILVNTFVAFGARHLVALPAQLCLPHQAGTVTAAVSEQGDDIDLALRLSEHDGIGLPIMPDHLDAAAEEVIQTINAVAPNAPVTLYVPQARVRAYQDAVELHAGVAGDLDRRISVYADSWSRRIGAAASVPLDLTAGLGMGAGPRTDWRAWRWPLALATLVLLINVIGLNVDWWGLKREANALRAGMTQTFRNAFPKEPVTGDPVAQMQQKIAIAKRGSGQPAPDDFMALAAAFGEAWSAVVQNAPKTAVPGIAALEYRERSLFVRLKPEGTAPTDPMRNALAARQLSLVLAPSPSAAVVWQIKSAK
jgi:general secretion pathway protein L